MIQTSDFRPQTSDLRLQTAYQSASKLMFLGLMSEV